MKKILILADVPIWTLPGLDHYKRDGHYATWLKSLIPEFERLSKDQDLDMHWVSFAKNVGSYERICVYGQTFHIFPRWKKLVSMLTAYRFEISKLQKICDELKPDLLHAWGSEDVYGWAGSRLRCPVPRLFTLQGCLSEYLRTVGGNWIFRLQTAYEQKTIRKYKSATAESPQARKLLHQIQPELDVSIIDYGVDELFHSQTWSPVECPTVVMVGAVTQRKGIREAVEAFAHQSLSGVRLEVIGAGDLFAEMQEKSTANVVWLGNLERAEVAKRVAQAWAFLMPTYSDTGPTVVKEARVIGLPVITTNAAGASCYIKDGESGFVIAPRDTNAIITAIQKITVSLTKCLSMGEYQHADTKNKLRSSVTAQLFVERYQNLIDMKNHA